MNKNFVRNPVIAARRWLMFVNPYFDCCDDTFGCVGNFRLVSAVDQPGGKMEYQLANPCFFFVIASVQQLGQTGRQFWADSGQAAHRSKQGIENCWSHASTVPTPIICFKRQEGLSG